jgi:ribonuclease P protein component
VVGEGWRRGTQRLDFFWTTNKLGHPRLGVVVPYHGATAVARNRLRRRLREIARRGLMPHLGAVDLVIRARRSAYRARFTDLAVDLEGWLQSATDPSNGRGSRQRP